MAGPRITNPHDKFFRAVMEHQAVAIDFLNHHRPDKTKQALNINRLKLAQQSYIDNDLQESVINLVFSCEPANLVDV